MRILRSSQRRMCTWVCYLMKSKTLGPTVEVSVLTNMIESIAPRSGNKLFHFEIWIQQSNMTLSSRIFQSRLRASKFISNHVPMERFAIHKTRTWDRYPPSVSAINSSMKNVAAPAATLPWVVRSTLHRPLNDCSKEFTEPPTTSSEALIPALYRAIWFLRARACSCCCRSMLPLPAAASWPAVPPSEVLATIISLSLVLAQSSFSVEVRATTRSRMNTDGRQAWGSLTLQAMVAVPTKPAGGARPCRRRAPRRTNLLKNC